MAKKNKKNKKEVAKKKKSISVSFRPDSFPLLVRAKELTGSYAKGAKTIMMRENQVFSNLTDEELVEYEKDIIEASHAISDPRSEIVPKTPEHKKLLDTIAMSLAKLHQEGYNVGKVVKTSAKKAFGNRTKVGTITLAEDRKAA